MSKTSKKIIIISLCLIILGAILTGLGFLLGGYPGLTISRSGIRASADRAQAYKLQKTKLDPFADVDLKIGYYMDLSILPSDDQNYYIEYLLDGNCGQPSYRVEKQTFSFYQDSRGIAFLDIGTYDLPNSIQDFYVRLYVPKDKMLGILQIYNDSGNISISNLMADSVDITCEYGDITLEDFACNSAVLKLDSSNAYIDTNKIRNLKCDSEYGDITLLVPKNQDTYTFDISVEYGNIQLPADTQTGYTVNSEDDIEHYKTKGTGDNTIQVTLDSGNVEIQKR
ncbi:MAG: DUF4097 family beta strand repeat protein [Ruminococcus sp.]|nr:DUF4097 family beta strand repeat protein [Ruminococcus sp.]